MEKNEYTEEELIALVQYCYERIPAGQATHQAVRNCIREFKSRVKTKEAL